MKLNYYISELRNALPSDYHKIDTRLLIRLLNEFRTIYIKNEYNRNRSIDTELAQFIDFEVRPSDQSTIAYISTSGRILKSVEKIPKVVKLSHRDLVLEVRNPQILSDRYNYVTKEEAIYSGNGRYNKGSIYCFIHENNLFIKTKKENPRIALLSFVSFGAIFENPLDCIPFQYNEYIDPLEYEYPMTDTIWGYVKANILRDGLQVIQANEHEEKTEE